MTEIQKALEAVQSWIDEVVIRENLCPFARKAKEQTHLMGCSTSNLEQTIQRAIEMILSSDTNTNNVVVAIIDDFSIFDDFWMLCLDLEANLESADLLKWVQLAHFHPDYLFEGLEQDDPANWSNRAPLPCLHFLCAQNVEAQLEAHRAPLEIPERNIKHLKSLSKDELTRVQSFSRVIQSS